MRLTYVRFGCQEGAFPPDGLSGNFITGEKEKGVSVYEALERDGKYQILLPALDPFTVGTLGQCYNVAQGLWGQENHPLYEISGILIGMGSDGEPLLKDCKVIKQIFHKGVK